mgnify:CR=1 FL=1
MNLEKMTKDQLITIINEQTKEIDKYKKQENYIKELEDKIELYKYLDREYVSTMEENQKLNNSIYTYQGINENLQDLCDRQQKIIDSKIFN